VVIRVYYGGPPNNFSLELQEKAENSYILVLKMIGSKNVGALEFACILGRNIKCSVIIIINNYFIYMLPTYNRQDSLLLAVPLAKSLTA